MKPDNYLKKNIFLLIIVFILSGCIITTFIAGTRENLRLVKITVAIELVLIVIECLEFHATLKGVDWPVITFIKAKANRKTVAKQIAEDADKRIAEELDRMYPKNKTEE